MWNSGPVYGDGIYQLVVGIGRYLPFKIDLSLAKSREGNSEGYNYLGDFGSVLSFLFVQRELFNIYYVT